LTFSIETSNKNQKIPETEWCDYSKSELYSLAITLLEMMTLGKLSESGKEVRIFMKENNLNLYQYYPFSFYMVS
jgi:hypothetical protein